MADPKLTKALVMKMNAIITEKDPEKKKIRIAELIEDLKAADLTQVDRNDVDPFISVLVRNISDSTQIQEIIPYLEMISPGNKSIAESKVLENYSAGNYLDVIRLVTSDQYFCDVENIVNLVISSADHLEKYDSVALFLSKCGRYDDRIAAKYAERDRNDSTTDDIIDNYEKHDDCRAIISFLRNVLAYEYSEKYLVKIIECGKRVEDNESIIYAVDLAEPDRIEDAGASLVLASTALDLGKYEKARQIADRGLKLDPGNYDLKLVMARSLYGIGRINESLDFYRDVCSSQPENRQAVYEMMDILYNHGRTKEYAETLTKVNRENFRPEDYIRISSLVKESGDVSGSVNLLKEAVSKFPDNADIMKAYAATMSDIGNMGEAFQAYRHLISIRPEDDSVDFVMRYLFDRRSYEDILEIYESLQKEALKEKYIGLAAASYIYMGYMDDAVKMSKEHREILDDPYFVDSILFSVRDKDQVEMLISAGLENTYSSVSLDRLLGKEIRGVDYILEYASKSCSRSMAFIAAESVFRKMHTVPDKIKTALSTKCLEEVYDIMVSMQGIYTKENIKVFEDHPRYLYPAIDTFITAGLYDDAYRMINRYEGTKDDPFLDYEYARLMYVMNRSKDAIKLVRRAKEAFPNVDFYLLSITIDEDSVVDDISAILDLDRNAVPYRIIREKYLDNHNIMSGIISLLHQKNLQDHEVMRLERDYLFRTGKKEEAINVSASLIKESKDDEDLRAHFSILRSINEDSAADFLLHHMDKFGSMDDLREAAHSLYRRRNFEDAIAVYRVMISRGANPVQFPEYIDCLIEAGNYAEADDIISRLPSVMPVTIKFYIRMGKTDRVVEYLNSKGEKSPDDIKYIARVGWSYDDIREAFLKYYEESGDLVAGKVIMEKFKNEGRYQDALRIASYLYENYGDADAGISYVDLLRITGDSERALQVAEDLASHCSGNACVEVYRRIYGILYDMKRYGDILKMFRKRKDADSSIIPFVVRSYLAEDDVDQAEETLSQYSLPESVKNSLMQAINEKRYLDRLSKYTSRILTIEFKQGRKLSLGEMISRADVPDDFTNDIKAFFDDDKYLGSPNTEYLERISSSVIRRIAEKEKIHSSDEIYIHTIFGHLDPRDPVMAKNLYVYIRMAIRGEHAETEEIREMAEKAMADKVEENEIEIIRKYGVGIKTAAAVVRMMKHMKERGYQNVQT
ncbi:lipopolysaccharide assembly protein LapB [Thermoplasma sp.]|uniref:tetratricopeptide repeat protein n=1 Tax=Thermoplasma sp. TaxID=1973142 RepID=UPI001278A407|nr:tetratricopeptide repeat protein [Thermoplasma sp.]KAA8923456.1 MAG: tetratricopeptide repeat protein [Thermoplasma sp.]